jgi:hypothetical protein
VIRLERLVGAIRQGYRKPITVDREAQRLEYVENYLVSKPKLTLEDLSFVKQHEFAIEEQMTQDGGFLVKVFRSRLETEEERQTRVQLEALYMQEYKRRNPGAEK